MKLAIDQKPREFESIQLGSIATKWRYFTNETDTKIAHDSWERHQASSKNGKCWPSSIIKHQNKTRHWRPACFGRFLLSWPARWLPWMDLAPKSVEGSCDLKRTLAPPAAQLVIWKITIFNGKINYKWSFSIAMLNYQRVDHVIRKNCTPDPHNDHWNRRVNCHMLLSAGADRNQPSWEWLQLYLRA